MKSINKIKITPIGGIGQIGSNMTLFEVGDESVIIDSGMLFPNDRNFGVNYLIANFLEMDFSNLKGIFITHCHEDHIGAIYHLLKKVPDLKIYCEEFSKCIIKNKINHHGDTFHIINEFSDISFENFSMHSFRVNHSTANTLGFILKSNEDSIIYSSDFKVDLNPQYETPINFKRIKELTKESKRKIAMLDSTNILYKGKTPSETDLIPELEKTLSHPTRTIVTLFASNIYRLITMIKICHKKGKIPVLYGRSMHNYYKAAIDSEIISDKGDTKAFDIENIDTKRDNIVVFASGCQGDFRSTFTNIVKGQSNLIKITAGDLFVFSSSVIPGNMKNIQAIYNMITQKGGEIITSKDALIHCSGHAAQEDLKIFINEVKPTDVIPIHGESYFIKKHVEFIKDNFPEIKTQHIYNFSEVTLGKNIKVSNVEAEAPLIIGNNKMLLHRQTISERRKISEAGIVFIIINTKNNDIDLKSYGVQWDKSDIKSIKDLTKRLYIKRNIAEDIRIKVRREITDMIKSRPFVSINLN